MSVAPISAGNPAQYTLESNLLTDLQQLLRGLQPPLDSGDLSAAKAALDAYQQINLKLPAANGSSTPATFEMAAAFRELTTTLSSGDQDGARQALATLEKLLNIAQTPLARTIAAMKQTAHTIEDRVDLSGSLNPVFATVDPTMQALATAYGIRGPAGSLVSPKKAVSSNRRRGNIGNDASLGEQPDDSNGEASEESAENSHGETERSKANPESALDSRSPDQ